ncbi:MAG: alpha/beta fold hydrolase [Alphaproteobacteria bacterium]
MPRIRANGVSLNYRIDGPEGAPWITFSNSLATNHTMWNDQTEALAGRFRVLRYDTRGHGESEATKGDYGFDLLVGDVAGLWDSLGVEQSHFVGLSMGGMTGIGLALGHGRRLLSLAACDCRADSPEPFREDWRKRRAAVEERGIEAIVEGNLERWFTPEMRQGPSALLDRVRAMIRTTSVDGFFGCTGALMNLDYLSRIDQIRAPTLFVVGAKDGPHPELMKAMHARLPGSRYAVIEDAAHLSNLERPERFNRVILDFLGAS